MENGQNTPLLRDRVRLIRIQTFFDNARGNPLFLMVAGLFFALLLHGEGGPESHLQAWLALLSLSCGMAFFFERYVEKTGLSPENAERLFRTRTLLGGMVAALFGASVVFLPEQATRTAHAFVFIITLSVVAAGYLAYATAFSYCLLVNVLALLPFTVFCIYRYLLGGESFFLLMSISSVLWQIIFGIKALHVSRSVVGAIEVRERLNDEMAERRLAEKALRASQDQAQQLATMLRLMCDNVPDMIWAKDLENRYLFANKALCEKLLNAESTEEPLGRTFDFFVQRERVRHPEAPEWYTFGQFAQDVDRHAMGRDEPTIFEESGNVRGNPVFLDVHQARFINAQGEVIGTVGCARDITERKASEAFVQRLAHYDVLTDLPNRALLTDRLHQALAQTRRDLGKLAVLFLDLDRLKPINDTLGHDVGDQLLQAAAGRLREAVTRQSDTVARLGGDEFVILLQRIKIAQDAASVADKILHALSLPFSINRHSISISASIGIAIFPQHGDDGNSLLRNADAAMYAAKRAGRNGYRVFDASMTLASDNPDLA